MSGPWSLRCQNSKRESAPAICSFPIEALVGERTKMDSTNRRLMWHGMFLFLIGLITGFAEQHFANIRMGLAAHLEGVMNGIFLLALGGAWSAVNLRPAIKTTAYWTTLYGTYMNWVFTTLAAIFGTGALSPITAS